MIANATFMLQTARLLAGWTIHPVQRDGHPGGCRKAASATIRAQRHSDSGNPSPVLGTAIRPAARQSLAIRGLNGPASRPVNPVCSARQPSPAIVWNETITNPLAKVFDPPGVALRHLPEASETFEWARGKIPFDPQEEMNA
jgi:hypothetical protein